ncbi:MAG: RsmB/NOP family class I SAM-dependent RNA methyltransferase [Holosporaceae bacterium]|jgi:16S rRNA (cytosine967-C5)-methyltransferase|nr:RsmB/NOP family class I SAM-dependent RNA methyltransferase [Holosporaceae bacterium]
MHVSARLQVIIEVLDIFLASRAPFDAILGKFFRDNGWIGSSDRREIAEFSYAMFRNFEKLKFFTSAITANFGRFYVLTFLKLVKNLSSEKMAEIFCGRAYGPQKLTEFELRFLDSLDLQRKIPLHVRLNYPSWLEPLLAASFLPENLEEEMLAMNQEAPPVLRVNVIRAARDVVRKMLADSGFQVEETKMSHYGLRIDGRIGRDSAVISNGFAEMQDEGSQLIAEICRTEPGNTVVDFCAGAGGKTLALAAIMKNKGRIFAMDVSEKRLERAQLRLRRAGVSNVFCQLITNKWIKRHLGCADVVLVDSPCSGTGAWRRNPDARARFTESDLEELILLQREILLSAVRLVKTGGRLVYATCSILTEENQRQVEEFLRKFPGFRLLPVELPNYSGQFLRLTPHQHQTDGFFGAIFERTS